MPHPYQRYRTDKKRTKRIADNGHAILRVGYYKGYHGNELSEAVAEFSSKYPTVEVSIMVGSHEELYRALETDKVDLVLNDQRRALGGSDLYNNEILSESRMYIEISNHNPLSRLEVVEIAELKNIPCILVMNPAGQWEEQSYYEDIVGIKGDYLFF